MGEGTFVTKPVQGTAVQKPRTLHLRFDVPLLITVACLLVIGLLMVYSASWSYSIKISTNPNYVVQRQMVWVMVGCAVAFILSMINYRNLAKVALPLMVGTLVSLLIVLIIHTGGDPSRTLLGGSVQPSELAKIVIILYLAVWLNSKKDQITSISFGLAPMTVILGLTSGLVLLQPDLSAAGTIFLLGVMMFYISGGELRQLVLIAIVVLLIGSIIVAIDSTGQQRIGDYIAGLLDPQRASYHVQRSMESVVRGGIFGVGIGKGSTKFTGLPVPWTDSIFAVIAEETGLLGAMVVVGLYVVILWRGFSIANHAPDFFGKILASGLSLWIVSEAMINIGVMVNLVPFAGNALPLVSAGGSNLVTTMCAVGILMSIARSETETKEEETPERRAFSAVVDLRRRDRRRSVPRTSRPASPRR
jgi:cell division protein FtsW